MTSEPDWHNNPWDHFDEQGKAIQQGRDDGWSIWADGKYHHRVEVDGKIYVDGKRVHPPVTWWERFVWFVKDLTGR